MWEVRARRILDVAQELLIARGYREASMDEIAARVGIAKGTLYQHFPSKEALVQALFEQHVARFERTVDEAVASDLPARERLERIIRYVYDDRDGAFTMLQLLANDVELRGRLGPRKGEAMARLDRTTAQVGRIIGAGRADGSLDPTVPTGLALRAFLGALTLGRPGPGTGLDGMSRAELAGHVARVLFEGIAHTER
jgi:AcrR family transcriptional regulator